MRYIADFHIHSRFSRATSQEMNIERLNFWAKVKGVDILGTGDFTHPGWLAELKENLEEAEEGLFKLKKSQDGVRFILTSEVSCVYSKNGRVRKIHLIIFAPSFSVVEKINAQLSWSSNLKADGRPTLGMDAKEVLKIVLDASPECLVVPAHVWTPWFSLFGSRSGFDSIEECFEEMSSYIFALETGLSSDPEMNWRWSALDKYTLISNSDSHSPQKIGREANIFEGEEISYPLLIQAIKNGGEKKDRLSLSMTVEFFPEEGKYHYDGHRFCQVRLSPKERKKYGGICPNCGKPLTIGVLSRVDELSDREKGEMPPKGVPFKKIIPLMEILKEVKEYDSNLLPPEKEYEKLISYFGNEFEILLSAPLEEMEKFSPKLKEAIERMREGKVHILPGFDGEYGKVQIFGEEEKISSPSQKTLF